MLTKANLFVRWSFFTILFISVLCIFIGCPSEPIEKSQPIKIGRILPLTGGAASYGQSEQKGTMLALEEINAAGGIAGKPLEIIYEDTQCLVKNGVNAMNKLVDVDKVQAVLGATVSGITLAIAPIANEKKVLLLSPLSSAAAISQSGPFVFRVMPSDAFQSRILANWVFSEGHKNLGILYINNAWGKGVSEGFVSTFTSLGGNVISIEACKEGDRDFRTQLIKIRDSNPDALFCPTMPQEGGIILRQIKELGMTLPIYGGDSWSAAELIQGTGNAAEGVKYTYPAQFTGSEYQAFANAFRTKFGEEPDVNAAGAYDATNILAMCMKRVIQKGETLTGDNIRRQMESVTGYKGATGVTTFDENGDSVAKDFMKMIIRNGKREKYEK